MKFIDSLKIRVRSGDGGDGLASFRSARNLPKLGADGGDGGDGGNVYFQGEASLNTLSHLRHMMIYAAGHGERGGNNDRTGANGAHKVVMVPLGTMVTREDSGEVICEVLEQGKKYLVAQGGFHGLGNMRYLSSTHQAPENFTEGTLGEFFEVQLELKLIADVGLAGFPNAGKSTLVSSISAARPKIADYPFTTLLPSLGVVNVEVETGVYGSSFVVADIPGLVEGASDGRGLGHDFLRHLERNRVILYLIDPCSFEQENPIEAFEKLRFELRNYSREMYDKPSLVVLSKLDLVCDDEAKRQLAKKFKDLGHEVLFISSVSGLGLADLKRKIFSMLQEQPKPVVDKVERLEKDPFDHEFQFLVKSKANAELRL